eukprot:6431590-Alexandrium_andersonii.AAC.1
MPLDLAYAGFAGMVAEQESPVAVAHPGVPLPLVDLADGAATPLVRKALHEDAPVYLMVLDHCGRAPSTQHLAHDAVRASALVARKGDVGETSVLSSAAERAASRECRQVGRRT